MRVKGAKDQKRSKKIKGVKERKEAERIRGSSRPESACRQGVPGVVGNSPSPRAGGLDSLLVQARVHLR